MSRLNSDCILGYYTSSNNSLFLSFSGCQIRYRAFNPTARWCPKIDPCQQSPVPSGSCHVRPWQIWCLWLGHCQASGCSGCQDCSLCPRDVCVPFCSGKLSHFIKHKKLSHFVTTANLIEKYLSQFMSPVFPVTVKTVNIGP